MLLSTQDTVIGRAPIHYELKEAYLPSNVLSDTWAVPGGSCCCVREVIKLLPDNGRSQGSLVGKTNFLLF